MRAYLEGADRSWLVMLPNGIVPLEGNATDAPEIPQLYGRAYTYLLPLEVWGLVIVVGVPALFGGARMVRRLGRRSRSDETGQ